MENPYSLADVYLPVFGEVRISRDGSNPTISGQEHLTRIVSYPVHTLLRSTAKSEETIGDSDITASDNSDEDRIEVCSSDKLNSSNDLENCTSTTTEVNVMAVGDHVAHIMFGNIESQGITMESAIPGASPPSLCSPSMISHPTH